MHSSAKGSPRQPPGTRPFLLSGGQRFDPATPSLGSSCEVPWFRQLGGSAGCRTRIARTGEQDAQPICIRNASATALMQQELAGSGRETPAYAQGRPLRDSKVLPSTIRLV